MGADVRRGKCCCGECEWPIITTTSSHLLSHIPANGSGRDTQYLQTYGGVVVLSSPNGTIPTNDMTFYNDWTSGFTQSSANHWHASPRTALNDISAGDRAGWCGAVGSPQTSQFQLYTHQYLRDEVTCEEIHSLWTDFQATSAYTNDPALWDVGIPENSRLFWLVSASDRTLANGRMCLIFHDDTWSATAYRQYYLADTLSDAYESIAGETDSIPITAQTSYPFCSFRCDATNYFRLMRNIQ